MPGSSPPVPSRFTLEAWRDNNHEFHAKLIETTTGKVLATVTIPENSRTEHEMMIAGLMELFINEIQNRTMQGGFVIGPDGLKRFVSEPLPPEVTI